MTGTTDHSWPEANKRYLMAALALVRHALVRHAAGGEDSAEDELPLLRRALQEAADALPSPSALEVLCARFGLSPYERDLLLLCAGMELDSSFAPLCAAAQGEPSRNYPTFSLAMAALAGPDWNALTPAAPLRYWRLIEAGSGASLTAGALRIDERVLHYLAGVHCLDERLAGIVEPVEESSQLVPSHGALAMRIVGVWVRSAEEGIWPAVQICGSGAAEKRAIALEVASELGMSLYAISAQAIPAAAPELDALIRLWERESLLHGNLLLLECDEPGMQEGSGNVPVARLAGKVRSMVMISSREQIRLSRRSSFAFDVRRPVAEEQRQVWHAALGADAAAMNGDIGRLVSQFNLSAPAIRAACAAGSGSQELLWDACRDQARPALESLAQRIEPAAGWDDLVLPEPQMQVLRRIAVHLRGRGTVYGEWGFAGRSARGLGISALFAGASGTGKTMAAEVLAGELRLDLFRIDLSSVVSKYIGETEKNLRLLFDAAEDGGAILFFDEADALFGRRSEVKDSHDRYANIEVSYLLQRMESYRGLAILTTNMKGALDNAFLRRIRFIVEFPFPDTRHRMEIWRRAFPAATPTEGLDVARLARLNVSGGNISNIALGAAFLAAEAGEPVRMRHLLAAARDECGKLEKPLTEAEIGGWV